MDLLLTEATLRGIWIHALTHRQRNKFEGREWQSQPVSQPVGHLEDDYPTLPCQQWPTVAWSGTHVLHKPRSNAILPRFSVSFYESRGCSLPFVLKSPSLFKMLRKHHEGMGGPAWPGQLLELSAGPCDGLPRKNSVKWPISRLRYAELREWGIKGWRS